MNETGMQSLGIIRRELVRGKLGAWDDSLEGCVYDDKKGKHCAIGAIVPAAILSYLYKWGDLDCLGAEELYQVALRYGIDLEVITGFHVQQAIALQQWHDSAFTNVGRLKYISIEEFGEVLEMLMQEQITYLPMECLHAAGRYGKEVRQVKF